MRAKAILAYIFARGELLGLLFSLEGPATPTRAHIRASWPPCRLPQTLPRLGARRPVAWRRLKMSARSAVRPFTGLARQQTSVAWRGATGTSSPWPTLQSTRTTSATAECAARHQKLAGQRLPLAPVRLAPAAARKQGARLHRLLSLDPASYRAPAAAGAAPACSKQSEARSAEARRAQQRRAVPGTLTSQDRGVRHMTPPGGI